MKLWQLQQEPLTIHYNVPRNINDEVQILVPGCFRRSFEASSEIVFRVDEAIAPHLVEQGAGKVEYFDSEAGLSFKVHAIGTRPMVYWCSGIAIEFDAVRKGTCVVPDGREFPTIEEATIKEVTIHSILVEHQSAFGLFDAPG